MSYIVGLAHALELERPVYMGCSMGGHLAPDLALYYPDEFRAVIGVEAALESQGVDRLLPWFYHPRVGQEFKPALMYSLMAPESPEPYKRETIWTYSQGAPVVFKGDLNYYALEHNLTGLAHEIDTKKVGVYVLSGEYDWSARPEDSRKLADAIPGAHFTEMKGVGHFPMCENPEAFLRYLKPVLAEIKKTSAR
jgi:pimeloyl-ACP methyl ester carboxylesterase